MRMSDAERRSQDERAYTWKGQLQVGEDGELVVMQWLRQQGLSVEDLRQQKHAQRDDTDFYIEDAGAMTAFFSEVKTDTYNNDQVFFEMYTKERNPGALFKSRARVWYIYKRALGQIIEVEPGRVTAYLWWEDRKEAGPRKLFPVFNDKKVIRAWGVKVSVQELTNLGGVVHYLVEEADDTTDSQDPSGIDRGTR